MLHWARVPGCPCRWAAGWWRCRLRGTPRCPAAAGCGSAQQPAPCQCTAPELYGSRSKSSRENTGCEARNTKSGVSLKVYTIRNSAYFQNKGTVTVRWKRPYLFIFFIIVQSKNFKEALNVYLATNYDFTLIFNLLVEEVSSFLANEHTSWFGWEILTKKKNCCSVLLSVQNTALPHG